MPAIRHDDVLLRLIKDVSYIRSILNRVTVNLPLYDVANENTPAQLTGDEDDYNIGNYDLLRLTSSAAVSITGMRPGVKGRFLRLFNVGNFPITLEHQNAGSSVANRFKFSNEQSVVIPPNSNSIVYYDSTVERWIGGDTLSSGAVYCNIVGGSITQSIPTGAPATKLDPGVVVSDQYGFYDDANNQIVIPFDGVYIIWSYVTWNTGPGGGNYRELTISVDGFFYGGSTTVGMAGNNLFQSCQITRLFSEGEVVTFWVKHDAGINVDIGYRRTVLTKVL